MTKRIDSKKKWAKPILKCAIGVFKLAIIPHRDNDYRPHLIRRYGLVITVFIITGMMLGYNGATTGNVLGRQSDITISSLLEQTNQARDQIGETSLKSNDKLNQAAYLKASDMFADQYWAHNAPDGTQPWKWFGDVGYNYDEAGENLAKNFVTTSSVMTAWMNSSEHKANILKNDYQDVGFAVVSGELDGKPTSLVVALYGLSAESAIAGTQKSFAAASVNQSLLARFGTAIQSVSPALMGALVLVMLAIFAALLAHIYRRRLPKKLRQSWYRHHGLYKGIGLAVFGLMLIFLSGGGQI